VLFAIVHTAKHSSDAEGMYHACGEGHVGRSGGGGGGGGGRTRDNSGGSAASELHSKSHVLPGGVDPPRSPASATVPQVVTVASRIDRQTLASRPRGPPVGDDALGVQDNHRTTNDGSMWNGLDGLNWGEANLNDDSLYDESSRDLYADDKLRPVYVPGRGGDTREYETGPRNPQNPRIAGERTRFGGYYDVSNEVKVNEGWCNCVHVLLLLGGPLLVASWLVMDRYR